MKASVIQPVPMVPKVMAMVGELESIWRARECTVRKENGKVVPREWYKSLQDESVWTFPKIIEGRSCVILPTWRGRVARACGCFVL
jgi:hypothetical protein